MDEPVDISADDSMLVQLSRLDAVGPSVRKMLAANESKFFWNEDDFVPVSREEFSKGLGESIALARERGWIPRWDPGCQCATCRLWREFAFDLDLPH